jgi:hypothetical protein
MDAILRVIGVGIAVVLIVAAFVYLISPSRALTLLERTASGAVLLFLVAVLGSSLWNAIPRQVLIGAIPVISLTAYFVRQSHQPRRQLRLPLARLERRPVLPWQEVE